MTKLFIIIKEFFYKIKWIVVFIELLALSSSCLGQSGPKNSIITTIQYVEKHPFDSTQERMTGRLAKFLKKDIPMDKKDNVIFSMLNMNVNYSLQCFFNRAYLLGKAKWMYGKHKRTDKGSGRLEGIENVIDLYQAIRLNNRSFFIPLLSKLSNLKASGKLKRYITDFICQQTGKSPGEYLPPLQLTIHGYSRDTHYGYLPESPIKIGINYSYSEELEYLSKLKCPNGEKLSYQIIHAECNTNLYRKVTGKAALLDEYEIKIKGSVNPVLIYFDPYHEDTLYCPKGFIFIN